jgi:hypothetical protein
VAPLSGLVAGITGSNPGRGMNIFVFNMLCWPVSAEVFATS